MDNDTTDDRCKLTDQQTADMFTEWAKHGIRYTPMEPDTVNTIGTRENGPVVLKVAAIENNTIDSDTQ